MNRILVVVDMQNDFVSGSLGTKEAQEIVSNVIAKIKDYKENGFRVFATKDTHYEDNYFDTQEGKNLPVLHCIKDTWGWELVDGVKELIDPKDIFTKESFGSLNAMEEVSKLTKQETTEVEFIGLCTDICVISNVAIFKAIVPEIKVIVDSKCCAGVTPEKHESALETMRSIQVEVL